MKNFFKLSPLLLVTFGVVIGLFSGSTVYTFYYANGVSYFSDNPKACMNCHVMKPHYDSWNKSTHHAVTTCNSCHAPRDQLSKYITKAINGFNHSWAFSFDSYEDNLKIRPWNKEITLKTCMNCHKNFNHPNGYDKNFNCTSCHKGVGHF